MVSDLCPDARAGVIFAQSADLVQVSMDNGKISHRPGVQLNKATGSADKTHDGF